MFVFNYTRKPLNLYEIFLINITLNELLLLDQYIFMISAKTNPLRDDRAVIENEK